MFVAALCDERRVHSFHVAKLSLVNLKTGIREQCAESFVDSLDIRCLSFHGRSLPDVMADEHGMELLQTATEKRWACTATVPPDQSDEEIRACYDAAEAGAAAELQQRWAKWRWTHDVVKNWLIHAGQAAEAAHVHNLVFAAELHHMIQTGTCIF